MRTHHLLAAALSALPALGVPSLSPAQEFEGTVRTRSISISVEAFWERMESLDPHAILNVPIQDILRMRDVEVEEVIHYVKGSKFRTQPVGGNAPYGVADLDRGIFLNVQPDEQVYVEWTLADMQDGMGPMTGPMPKGSENYDAPKEDATIRPLGKTRTINGARTTGYEVRSGEDITWAWVTNEFTAATRAFRRMIEDMDKLMPGDDDDDDAMALYAQHGLPMLVQELTVYDGQADGSYEIEEIILVQQESVSDSMFEAPAGYRKMTLQDMMRRMMQ